MIIFLLLVMMKVKFVYLLQRERQFVVVGSKGYPSMREEVQRE